MLPSKCPRCGASTRDALCARCVEYLTQHHPLWLDPDLLPGPSVLDQLDPRDEAWLSMDPGADLEWHPPAARSPATAAIAIVDGLRLGEGQALLSEGDAEVLHRFLFDRRLGPPKDPRERDALSALCRHIASIPSMPPHLADEYATRARILSRPAEPARVAPGPPRVESPAAPPEAPPEPAPMEEMQELEPLPEEPTPETPSPEPSEIPAPEIAPEETEEVPEESDLPVPREEEIPPPLPGPHPEPEPAPEPEPEPEPEPMPEPEPEEMPLAAEERRAAEEVIRVAREAAAKTAEDAARLEAMRTDLTRERDEIQSWVEGRSQALEAREVEILDRVRSIEEKEAQVRAKEAQAVAKVSDLEAKEREVREKIEWVEKDDRRRAVMEFLDSVPGMTIQTAKAITNAFPEMEALREAEVRALTQCEGVTEALAKEIRVLLAPEALESPADLREQAHLLLEDGDTEGALRVIEEHLRTHPEDETAWFDKAELLVMLERPSEALHCYSRVIDLNRANRQAWYEKANLLFGAGRLVDAIDSLREALRLDLSKSPEILLKADQLRMDGKLSDATLLFQTVLEVDPENQRAVLGLGDTLMALGDVAAAEALVTRALGRDPANPGALYRKGALLNRKGRWGAALQLYNRAIALRWDYADPWAGKGEIYLRQEKPREALECFDKALEFDKVAVGAWLGKAQAHWALGEKETAQACLNHAVKLSPHAPGVREVAELFERVEEAVHEEPAELPADFKAFIDAVEPEKEETETLLQLAEMALEGGDPEMAIVRYDQAIEKDPRSADAWTGKGIALQYQEKYDEALACYDRALAIHPGHDLATKWRETCAKRLEGGG